MRFGRNVIRRGCLLGKLLTPVARALDDRFRCASFACTALSGYVSSKSRAPNPHGHHVSDCAVASSLWPNRCGAGCKMSSRCTRSCAMHAQELATRPSDPDALRAGRRHGNARRSLVALARRRGLSWGGTTMRASRVRRHSDLRLRHVRVSSCWMCEEGPQPM